MRQVVAVAVALLLCGCARMNYVLEEYTGISAVPFDVPGDDVYRVFDKPAASKLMITPSAAKALGMGAESGLYMGRVDTTPPKALYERASLAYLASTGRPNCRIIDGDMVLKPQWEFKYDCSPVDHGRASSSASRR